MDNFKERLCIVDFLFQHLQDKSHSSSLVLPKLLKKKRYDLVLYFLKEGYCRYIDKKKLMNQVCRQGHVKLVQWILAHFDHKDLDIKSAFLEACKCKSYGMRLLCLALMWHYIQDITVFEVDTILNTITEAPRDNDLRNWLLYIKKINQKVM